MAATRQGSHQRLR